nr:hypothetical protein [Tanacetum cinerariifolium]
MVVMSVTISGVRVLCEKKRGNRGTCVLGRSFPPSLSAKELWNSCSKFGIVLDVYIPLKTTRNGKRFAFFRFNKVNDVDLLIRNLKSIWLGSYHLFANVARFNRNSYAGIAQKVDNSKPSLENNSLKTSFASLLKGPNARKVPDDPVLVLERRDLNYVGDSALVQCVKEFKSLPNIHIVCTNEGFFGLSISYLGGFWILIEFDSPKSCEKFKLHEVQAKEVAGWALDFNDDYSSTSDDGSIKLSEATHNWESENKVEVVEDYYNCHAKINENEGNSNVVPSIETLADPQDYVPISGDPFGLEDLIRNHPKKLDADVSNYVPSDPAFPPGFTTKDNTHEEVVKEQVDDNTSPISCNKESNVNKNAEGNKMAKNFSNPIKNSMQDFSDSNPTNGFSILECFQEFIKIGQAMGYNMKGSEKDFRKIITSMGEHNVVKWIVYPSIYKGLVERRRRSSSARGWSGGILCVWDNSLFRKRSVKVSEYCLCVEGTWLASDTDLLLVSIYSPYDLLLKRVLWSYMANIINQWNDEVVVMGDFNEVHDASERYGSVFHAANALEFNNFIVNSHLHEIPLGGYAFTWTDKYATKMSKIDRFLASQGFLDLFLNMSGLILDRNISDHRPILLKDVHNTDVVPSNNAMITLKNKLKNLKSRLNVWNRDKRLTHNLDRKHLHDSITAIDVRLDQGAGLPDDIPNRSKFAKELGDLNKKDSIDLAQKAKVKWAIEGEENSKYFHGIVNKKRRSLSIKGILKDGEWIDNPNRVKAEFYHHFSSRFSQSEWARVPLVADFPKRLSVDLASDLELKVSSDEIKKAVWDCGLDKSPGPDGFTFEFFKKHWSIMGCDVISAIKEFFSSSLIPNGCNASFISLIPKVLDAKHLNDFRPISLVVCQYKIIGKILSSRLSNERSLLFKVDFQKAFDSVRWDHLDDILGKFGFGNIWRGWIKGCLSSSKALVLVNGSPTDEFMFYRGLRQGDPLSPFLFILVAISHLFYADDAIFIGKWTRENVNTSMLMLHCFFLSSGLKINVHKSSIFGIGVRASHVNSMAARFGCTANSTPFTYLGVKVGANMKRTSSWDVVASHSSLWVSVIKAIHACDGSLNSANSNHGYSVWSGISQAIGKLNTNGINLFSFCKLVLGNGQHIKFWHDKWHGEVPFKDAFKRCYNLEPQKDITVANKFLSGDIALTFRRYPRSGIEEFQLGELISLTNLVTLSNNMDRWSWSLCGSENFSVKSTREYIDQHYLVSSPSPTKWSKAKEDAKVSVEGLFYFPLVAHLGRQKQLRVLRQETAQRIDFR